MRAFVQRPCKFTTILLYRRSLLSFPHHPRLQAVLIHGIVTWLQSIIITWRKDIEVKMQERQEAEAVADPKKAKVGLGDLQP